MQPIQVERNNYTIKIDFSPDLEKLKTDWLSLQEQENPTCFLTWTWIRNWITTYNPDYLCVSAIYHDKVVAIGLFTLSTETRYLGISFKQLRLHQTGAWSTDQIWVEYNDFIALEKHRIEAVTACLQALGKHYHPWDEIVLSMMTLDRGTSVLQSCKNARIQIQRPCYGTDLLSIKHDKINYIESLRRNTRYQIRRSIRLYEQLHGPLEIHVASDSNQAIDYFYEIAPFHKERWDDSGFNNEDFLGFHENLIKTRQDDLSTELLKVTSGDSTIAIIYNFVVDKTVYFYLQGVHYEKDRKLKPGLVAHSLVTQHYLDRNMDFYDFMGGYSQYKEQLAERSQDLVTVVIKKSSIVHKLEQLALKIRNLVKR